MKQVAHIVSHSHWDREWYLGYEHHHMLLIELIDDILEIIKKDDKFHSFHLDGQTLLIQDYLQVRPEKQAELYEAIRNKKIIIGPWYILQDAFLTSSEANVRNMQMGISDSLNIDDYARIGYFPDTFGIYTQASQILKLSNIDTMCFGRGVTPTGFANQVNNDFSSCFSEMFIEAPDKSKTLGILFANWYSNGNEVPADKDEAKKYWDEKLASASKFASTNHLLFMNGCDHQPLQKDITEAIDVANELYPDVEFRHSSLVDYVKAVKAELKEEELDTITEELRSQNTDGYYTLVNTVSSRVYQKIANYNLQNMLEKEIEPLYAMVDTKYPHDKLRYAWRKLMENHPHDSICGCSVDSVHRSMDARFIDVEEIGTYLKSNIESEHENLDVTVINPTSITKRIHNIKLIVKKIYFRDMNFKLAKQEIDKMKVNGITANLGNVLVGNVRTEFGYDLPKDKFRQPYFAKVIDLTLELDIDAFSSKVVEFEVGGEVAQITETTSATISNEINTLTFSKDGIEVNGKANYLSIVDEGDVGNEYMFGTATDNNYEIKDFEVVSNVENTMYKEIKVKYTYLLPKSADDIMEDRKLAVTEHFQMDVARHKELIEQEIFVNVKLYNNDSKIHLNINLDNKVMDHRMKLRINELPDSDYVIVDSCFDVLKRSINVSDAWKNPTNDQPIQNFLNLENKLMVSTRGLYEYDVKDATYITLFRAIGCLGDWGHFETPEAQCLRELSFDIVIEPITENSYELFNVHSNNFVNTVAYQDFKFTTNNLDVKLDSRINVTSVHNFDGKTYLRGYNMSETEIILENNITKYNFLYEEIETTNIVREKEIITICISDTK